ncbi:phosphodiester glycosidase family protein [Kitasatospora sp. NPDC101155]|uniref:phosphodiester glycosidase family protein n=1 Tax=Kitasatospora sp. NPDC101155 TaxID=3364097 RepID=UPI00380ABEF9
MRERVGLRAWHTSLGPGADSTPVPGFPANTPTDTDPGVEVLFDSAGAVTACYSPTATPGGIVSTAPRGGHTIPSGGRALQDIGDGATWRWNNACNGQQLGLHTVITDARFGDTMADTWFGQAPADTTDQPIDPAMYVTGGGDVLLRDASVVYQLSPDTESPTWRTAAGTDGWGHLVLVTIEGNRGSTAPLSGGATRTELTQLLKALNLVDAINLDGGGSTSLNMRDQNGNEPALTSTTESSPRNVADTVYAGVGGNGLAAR